MSWGILTTIVGALLWWALCRVALVGHEFHTFAEWTLDLSGSFLVGWFTSEYVTRRERRP